MVTRAPAAMNARHIEALRRHGLSDRDILDAVQVISYFNYINRVADALGIDPEPEMREAHEKWQAEVKVKLFQAPNESPASFATF